MPTFKVLDAHALLSFLANDPGADQVRTLLMRGEEGTAELAIPTITLGELWYAIAHSESPSAADRLVGEIKGMAIELVDVDWILAAQAAALKLRTGASFVACVTAALAKTRKGEVVTGDRHFTRLQSEVKIGWIASSDTAHEP